MEKNSEEKFSQIGRLSYDLFMATGGQDLSLYRLSVAGRQAARDVRLGKALEGEDERV